MLHLKNVFFPLLCLPTLMVCLLRAEVHAEDEASALPNVVFILVDDMGYGDPQCYNPQSKIPTPNIDQLAASGMRFLDAHASGPLCHMSRYGLMTGQYPFRINVNLWPKQPLIQAGQVTMASLLRKQGYRTAMVGKWHLGFLERGYDRPMTGGPVDVGFESYFGIRASTDIPPYFYIRGDEAVSPPSSRIEANYSQGWSKIQGAFWRAGGIAPQLQLKDVLPKFTDEAIEVIRNHEGRSDPLMLYLAYPAPHTPWLPGPEYRGLSGASMYGDFMVMVDAMIGRVVQTLRETGMHENTLIVFTSDNGPVWYPEDLQRFGHDSSGGLRGMKADAWENGHRMPFIASWPGHIQPGSTTTQLVSFVDVMATMAELTNYELPTDAAPDSFSFLPVLLGTQPVDQPTRPSLALRSGRGAMTIRKGPWKLIDRLGSGGFTKSPATKGEKSQPAGQLYNLDQDLAESQNLYQQNPEKVDELLSELQRIRSQPISRTLPR